MEVKKEPEDHQNIKKEPEYNENISIEAISNSTPEIVLKEVKILVRDARREFTNLIKEEDEKEFCDLVKVDENERKVVKKDPERNFYFLPVKEPEMPKVKVKMEVTKSVIKFNVRNSTNFSKFQCQICQKYLSSNVNLTSHTELHFQPSSYECKKCEKIFQTKGKFEIHKCVKKNQRHFCSFCSSSFSHSVSLSKHLKKVHAEESKIDWLYCDICNEKFKSKKYLKKHLKYFNHNKNLQTFSCDQCGKEFTILRNIRSHVLSHAIHKVECKICRIKIKQNSLSNHMKFRHNQNEVEVKCQICRKICKNSQLLKLHELTHKIKQFECRFCVRKFRIQSHLNSHMKFHENPEQFKCQICGHQSTTKSSLKNHLKIHDENREKNFKCDRCDFKTDRKADFETHLKSHQKKDEKLKTLPNAIKCQKCPSVLKNEYSYRKHLKFCKCVKEKLQCDHCQYKSARKAHLKLHILKKHLTCLN